jgi:hypothetical protein
LWVSHYLDSLLKDGGKVVSLTRRPHFTPQENYLMNSLEAESTPGPLVRPEGLGQLKKKIQ